MVADQTVPISDYILSGALVSVLLAFVGMLGKWVLPLAQRLIEVAVVSAEVMRRAADVLERVDRCLAEMDGRGPSGGGAG